jgi:hypothetical protein
VLVPKGTISSHLNDVAAMLRETRRSLGADEYIMNNLYRLAVGKEYKETLRMLETTATVRTITATRLADRKLQIAEYEGKHGPLRDIIAKYEERNGPVPRRRAPRTVPPVKSTPTSTQSVGQKRARSVVMQVPCRIDISSSSDEDAPLVRKVVSGLAEPTVQPVSDDEDLAGIDADGSTCDEGGGWDFDGPWGTGVGPYTPIDFFSFKSVVTPSQNFLIYTVLMNPGRFVLYGVPGSQSSSNPWHGYHLIGCYGGVHDDLGVVRKEEYAEVSQAYWRTRVYVLEPRNAFEVFNFFLLGAHVPVKSGGMGKKCRCATVAWKCAAQWETDVAQGRPVRMLLEKSQAVVVREILDHGFVPGNAPDGPMFSVEAKAAGGQVFPRSRPRAALLGNPAHHGLETLSSIKLPGARYEAGGRWCWGGEFEDDEGVSHTPGDGDAPGGSDSMESGDGDVETLRVSTPAELGADAEPSGSVLDRDVAFPVDGGVPPPVVPIVSLEEAPSLDPDIPRARLADVAADAVVVIHGGAAPLPPSAGVAADPVAVVPPGGAAVVAEGMQPVGTA